MNTRLFRVKLVRKIIITGLTNGLRMALKRSITGLFKFLIPFSFYAYILQHFTEKESTSKLAIFFAPRLYATKEKMSLSQPISKKLFPHKSSKSRNSATDCSVFRNKDSSRDAKNLYQFLPKENVIFSFTIYLPINFKCQSSRQINAQI